MRWLIGIFAVVNVAAQAADPLSPSTSPSVDERLRRLEQNQEQLQRELDAKDARIKELERQVHEAQAMTAPSAAITSVTPNSAAGKSRLANESTRVRPRKSMADEQDASPRPGNAPLDPYYSGFMQIAGSNSWIKLGGYVKLDMIYDTTRIGDLNKFVTNSVPVAGEPEFGSDSEFGIHAKQTQISLEFRSSSPLSPLRIYYQNDFFNNSKTTTSMDYLLAHFYGQVDNLIAGHTFSTFMDPDAIPDTLDFAGPGATPIIRQPQVRYIIPLKPGAMHIALALEQSKSDFSNIPSGSTGRNSLPDFVAQWRWEGALGHIQIAALVRELSYENTSTSRTEYNTTGYGYRASGVLNIANSDNLFLAVVGGEGIGRYIIDLPFGSAAVVAADGTLNALRADGAVAAYEHHWHQQWRSTFSYSYLKLDSQPVQGPFAFKESEYVQGNLIWAPTKTFSVGAEYLHGRREALSGASGNDSRVQMSLRYALVR